MEGKLKEVLTMNKLAKYAIVGLTGYFIGAYEMKRKVIKNIVQVMIEKENQEKAKEEEGAQ